MPMPPPFNDKDKRVGVVAVEHRSERGEEMDPGLEACAQELMRALDKSDVRGIALALQNAFYYLEAMPHEEMEQE